MTCSDFIHPNPATFFSFRRQNFSFPADVISHISKDPISTDGLLKLQKSCKYFFAKNKIIVVSDALGFYEIENRLFRLNNHQSLPKGKYWLTNKLETFDPGFFQLIYRCTLKELKLYSQDLTLNEIDFLLDGGEIVLLLLNSIKIWDDNEILVSIDKILPKVPNVEEFDYICREEIFTNEILKSMNALDFSSKIKNWFICIKKLKEDINFSILCDFIKKNAATESKFVIQFLCDNAENFVNSLITDAENRLISVNSEKIVYLETQLDTIWIISKSLKPSEN